VAAGHLGRPQSDCDDGGEQVGGIASAQLFIVSDLG